MVVGHPTGREGVEHAGFVVGGSTDGFSMQSQHVPHSYDCNSVNIQAIALVFVALDSSFQALQK